VPGKQPNHLFGLDAAGVVGARHEQAGPVDRDAWMRREGRGGEGRMERMEREGGRGRAEKGAWNEVGQ